MRVAVAGTCGLALHIAHAIHETTSHQLIILSRTAQPSLIAQGYQVQTVDYNDPASLQHALLGIDTVISTVTGPAQLRLIEAAVQVRVRRFAPAEFEGRPALRKPHGPLDRGRAAALAHLQHYRAHLQSTVFTCGVLYERFGPGGLAAHGLALRCPALAPEGAYLADVRHLLLAEAPAYDPAYNPGIPGAAAPALCLTAAADVGRFVARALDLPTWPPELSMCGERVSAAGLVQLIASVRGRPFATIHWHTPSTLQFALAAAELCGGGGGGGDDAAARGRVHALIATAAGEYDVVVVAGSGGGGGTGVLNRRFPEVRPLRFADWLRGAWGGVP